jgi:hypothetical protein
LTGSGAGDTLDTLLPKALRRPDTNGPQEDILSARERRTSPRKDCVVPLRFPVVRNRHKAQAEDTAAWHGLRKSKDPANAATLEGEALNISERGVYFTSREKLHVGEPLEMYFTLPREPTGRGSELAHCSARVVHVDEKTDRRALGGLARLWSASSRWWRATGPTDGFRFWRTICCLPRALAP